jgi:N-acetylmuramoyl-L-alanine amidase
VLNEGERSRRRVAKRARLLRRRAAGAILVSLLAALAATVVLAARDGGASSSSEPSAPAATGARQSVTLAVAPAGTTTVAGSSANEDASSKKAASAQLDHGVASATTSAPKPYAALKGATIAIDPGHNGRNYAHASEINRLVDAGTLKKPCDTTGTETNDGYSEASYTLDVALRLARILRQHGAHVVLTRTTNSGWGPCITERAAIGNRADADAAISIHADGGPASGRGFHVIYPPAIKGLTDDIAAQSRRLALTVRSAFRGATGMPYASYVGRSGLDVRSALGGLNLSDVPKVFIETGNMRNATDASLLSSSRFRVRAAQALARGLSAYLASR